MIDVEVRGVRKTNRLVILQHDRPRSRNFIVHVLTFHPPRSIVNDNGVFKFLFEEYHGLIELARILTEELVQLEEEVRYFL